MGYYDESRVRLPDGVTVRTLPGQDGVTDDRGWRCYERAGERLVDAFEKPALQVGRADYTDLDRLDAHWAEQEADPEQTAERIGSWLDGSQ